MTRVVLLDSGPLGRLVHPLHSGTVKNWVRRHTRIGTRVLVPAIVYYELRRELVRMRSFEAVGDLDGFRESLGYAPVTIAALTRASELWALARQQGRPTAHDRALDVDVILAATGLEIIDRGHDVTVATDNVAHLSQHLPAARWEDIPP